MKTLLTCSLMLLALGISVPAAADSWNARYSHGRHWSPSYDRHWNRHAWGHRSYNRYGRYGNNQQRWNSGFNVSYRSGWSRYDRHHHGSDVGTLVGGIVLGSLISTAVLDNRRPETVTRTVYRAPVVRNTSTVYSRSAPASVNALPNRRLLRDLQGNCFEITRNSAGDEVRLQLPAAECSF